MFFSAGRRLFVATGNAADFLKAGVINQSASKWPLFVAEEKGYFERAGLKVEVVVTGDSAK